MPKVKSKITLIIVNDSFKVTELSGKEYTIRDRCECGDEDCNEIEEWIDWTDEVTRQIDEGEVYALERHETVRGTVWLWTNLHTGESFTTEDGLDCNDCCVSEVDLSKIGDRLHKTINSFKMRAEVYNSITKKPRKESVNKNVLQFAEAIR